MSPRSQPPPNPPRSAPPSPRRRRRSNLRYVHFFINKQHQPLHLNLSMKFDLLRHSLTLAHRPRLILKVAMPLLLLVKVLLQPALLVRHLPRSVVPRPKQPMTRPRHPPRSARLRLPPTVILRLLSRPRSSSLSRSRTSLRVTSCWFA